MVPLLWKFHASTYYEWVVDCRNYNLERLQEDLASRVKWGPRQQAKISHFDMSRGRERKVEDDTVLSAAFSELKDEKKLFLFVDVVEKETESAVTLVESINDLVGTHGILLECLDKHMLG